MNYCEKLNEYIEMLNCTAKEISEASGLSSATLSRYRSGERIPEINSEAFNNICRAIAVISRNKHIDESITENSVAESFLECSDIIASDKELLRQKLNMMISAMSINITNVRSKISTIRRYISREYAIGLSRGSHDRQMMSGVFLKSLMNLI